MSSGTFCCPIHGYFTPAGGTTLALCPSCAPPVRYPLMQPAYDAGRLDGSGLPSGRREPRPLLDDFTVTGDELDRCLGRAEKAEADRDELRDRIERALGALRQSGATNYERVQAAGLILTAGRRKRSS